MTKEQLDAIRARLDAATPGPWRLESPFPAIYIAAGERDYIAELMGPWDDARWEQRWKVDAELIAHAPTDLRALLDEVEALQAEVRKQVFGSKVVFDREVVERAERAGEK